MKALSAPVGVPVDVVREYLDARACYEEATRPPNSHAPAPRLKHGDPIVLRLRAARVALDAALAAQQPAACGTCQEAIRPDALTGTICKCAQQPAAVDAAWQVQLADALECFWNPAIEGSGDDRSNIIGGMVQGFAAVAYRLREHAALAAQPGGVG